MDANGTERHDTPADGVEAVDAQFTALEESLRALAARHGGDLALVHPTHRSDAINLLHYLGLRRLDVHGLQRELAELGLSSLGRCEPHVMATICSIHSMRVGWPVPLPDGAVSFEDGRAALDHNTDRLFGARPHERVPRIMVTLDEIAADDYEHVRKLVSRGMNIARINGAHDTPAAWESMVDHVRRAAAELEMPCAVAMDLAGPKLRTGPLEDGPRVLRLRPRRDARGVPVEPQGFVLAGSAAEESPAASAGGGLPVVPVDPAWLARRSIGEQITIVDTRGKRRRARITRHDEPGTARAEIWDTTYLETGAPLRCAGETTVVGELPSLEQFHLLGIGDAISIDRSPVPAAPWRHGDEGVARLSCSLGEVFSSVRPGERIFFDDGKLGGVIESVEPDRFYARIEEAPPHGARLRAGKGINLPDTDLLVPVLSQADLPLVELAARCADMLSISFIRSAADVDAVRAALAGFGAGELAVVLKIETELAFANLPEILLHAMRSPSVGVMIARGDLAVEVGYARLAEIQEEILWLTEAAHLPVIWATDVLDRLATTGRPSRAEVTDAAMAQRAECVMLNKGPYLEQAIVTLDDILRRMARHQRKTVPLLRPLHSWVDF